MFVLTTILPFVGILLALVILHELGHYFAAKLAGVRVEEFGIGLPPRIRGKRFGETLYSINWLPIGGFVRLTGEEASGLLVERVNRYNRRLNGLHPGDRITHVNGKRVHSPRQFAERMADGLNKLNVEIQLTRTTADGGESYWNYSLKAREEPDPSGRPAALDPPITADPSAYLSPGDPRRGKGRQGGKGGKGGEGGKGGKKGREAELERASIFGITVGIDPRSLGAQSRLTRIGILAAGAGVNAVLPFFLFALAAVIPDNVSAGPAVVTSVVEGAPAQRAGIEPGDRIAAVNGDEIRNAQELTAVIAMNLGEDVKVLVERETVVDEFTGEKRSERFEVDLHARLAPPKLIHVVQEGESVQEVAALLGVPALHVIGAWGAETTELREGTRLELPGSATYVTQPDDTILRIAAEEGIRIDALYAALGLDPRYPPAGTLIEIPQGATGITVANGSTQVVKRGYSVWEAIPRGWEQIAATFVLVRNRIRSWIAGGEPIDLSGPVGIARLTGEVVEQVGWVRLIELAALLSLNLAIINILPLPMLDGGRIFFILIEIARRGKRISPEREGLVHLAGFGALLLFIVVISYFDIVRAVEGESLLR